MATLTIRRLDDQVYERLRERARSNRRSLEAEAREILTDKTQNSDKAIEQIIALQEEMAAKYGTFPDSTPLIRQMRDEE